MTAKDFQFVWWGLVPRCECGNVDLEAMFMVRFARFDGSMSQIYRWRLIVGPLELRRWVRP